jgi:hypothetical protein
VSDRRKLLEPAADTVLLIDLVFKLFSVTSPYAWCPRFGAHMLHLMNVFRSLYELGMLLVESIVLPRTLE